MNRIRILFKLFSRKLFVRLLFYFPVLVLIGSIVFWTYLSTEKISNLISIEEATNGRFHYIIIGAGTAGCVLAGLSENPEINVLLIEAGRTFSPLAMVPLFTSQQQRTSVDWQLQTTRQKYSSFGLIDQIQFLPRGKGLGGSSQLNYLLHHIQKVEEYEKWKSYGGSNWNITKEIVQKKESTNKNGVCISDSLPVTPITYNYSHLSSHFVDASIELQKTHTPLQYHLAEYNTKNGKRHTTYHSYLKPKFNRENLKILLNTRVHKVVFNKKKHATGLVVSEENVNDKTYFIPIKKEIILCAGAFNSPQILKLSGIGPLKELQRFKINVVHDSPLVGANLYDHMVMPIYVTVNESISITRDKILNINNLINYLIHGKGIYSNFGVIGYLNDKHKNHGVGIFGVGSIDDRLLRKLVHYEKNTFRKNFPFYNESNQEGFVLLNICHRPMSRGSIRLTGNSIYDQLAIDPEYLKEHEDIDCMIRAMRLSMRLIATNSFRKLNATMHWPKFNKCKRFAVSDDEIFENNSYRYLECIIRVAAVTAHHPGGSCSLSNSTKSVIDDKMRVRGVSKLRIVDASVIPTPISGNPHATIVSIAELATQMILNKNQR